MRAAVAFAGLIGVASLVAVLLPPPAFGQELSSEFHTIRATSDEAGTPVFVPSVITIGGVPRVITVTVVNDDPHGMAHTFTVRSAEADDLLVDLVLEVGDTLSVEFTMWGPTQIAVGARNESTESEGGNLRFFCRPHEAAGMVGTIVVGGVQGEEEGPEKGVFLRAYWIGVLGFAATLLVIGVSYFVIKGSSRHFRDHHEHVRRGGP